MTEPLVPADVDLRGTAWMPYFGHLMRASEFNATISNAGFRAAHNLWWAAWNEVPAASLPDDDRILCRMADLGTSIDVFASLKREVLHGFVKCDDGRLYHRFLAEVAVQQWEILGRENARKAAARNRMRRLREQAGDVTQTNSAITGEHNADVGRNAASPPAPPLGERNKNTRARARGKNLHSMKRGAAAPPPPVNPKFLNHGDACMCANCTRWAERSRMSLATIDGPDVRVDK